jgi:hypothetical protein
METQISNFEEALANLYRDERRDAKLLKDGPDWMKDSTRKVLERKLRRLQSDNNNEQLKESFTEGQMSTIPQRIAAIEWILANI